MGVIVARVNLLRLLEVVNAPIQTRVGIPFRSMNAVEALLDACELSFDAPEGALNIFLAAHNYTSSEWTYLQVSVAPAPGRM